MYIYVYICMYQIQVQKSPSEKPIVNEKDKKGQRKCSSQLKKRLHFSLICNQFTYHLYLFINC